MTYRVETAHVGSVSNSRWRPEVSWPIGTCWALRQAMIAAQSAWIDNDRAACSQCDQCGVILWITAAPGFKVVGYSTGLDSMVGRREHFAMHFA